MVEGTRPPLPLPSFLRNGLGLGMGVVSPLPRMAMENRQPRMEELAPGRTHPPRALGRHGSPVPGRARGPSRRLAGLCEPRLEGQKQTKPSAIRQDRELEAAYQKVAAHRAQQRPDAPRLSRSSYMRNRSRPPKAVRQAKGGGKDRARGEPASHDGAPPGVRPPPPKPERSEQPVAAALQQQELQQWLGLRPRAGAHPPCGGT